MQYIKTPKAPAAIGPYSQAIKINGMLFVSGQVPLNPEKMTLAGPTIQEQTMQCLTNILAIVEEAGLKKENIVKCGVFMLGLNQFKEMNAVYEQFFKDHKPARFAVEVKKLPANAIIEIDAIAVK